MPEQPHKSLEKVRNWIFNGRFQFHGEKAKPGYISSRRLLEKSSEVRDQSYMSVLPEFEGKSFFAWVNAKIAERENEARETGQPYRPVTIVDIGYGKGMALRDMTEQAQWKGKVRLVGYGDKTLSRQEVAGDKSMAQVLEERNVQLIDGNITTIDKTLRKALGRDFQADIMLAVYVFRYIDKFPNWTILKRIYRTLADTGIAFLNDVADIKLRHSDGSESPLNTYLTTRGYKWEAADWSDESKTSMLAFQRTRSHPRLPNNLANEEAISTHATRSFYVRER